MKQRTDQIVIGSFIAALAAIFIVTYYANKTNDQPGVKDQNTTASCVEQLTKMKSLVLSKPDAQSMFTVLPNCMRYLRGHADWAEVDSRVTEYHKALSEAQFRKEEPLSMYNRYRQLLNAGYEFKNLTKQLDRYASLSAKQQAAFEKRQKKTSVSGTGKGSVRTLRAESMNFDDCVQRVDRTIDELGVPSITVVSTRIMKLVTLETTDGKMILTCSGPDQKLTVTLSTL